MKKNTNKNKPAKKTKAVQVIKTIVGALVIIKEVAFLIRFLHDWLS